MIVIKILASVLVVFHLWVIPHAIKDKEPVLLVHSIFCVVIGIAVILR